jgi:hypothetical protein
MTSGHVVIGPAFFRKELNEYANWRWAIIREFAQNSIDARGTTVININIALNDAGNTVLMVSNNGQPMSRDTLLNKLLALGESGKNFEDGSVGGFGKAKIILYYAHQSYTIHTGTLFVSGSGGSYDLSETEPFHGTCSTITIDGDHVDALLRKAKEFTALAQWSGDIVINGVLYECALRKGSPRKEFTWGTIYTNKATKNLVVVRMGGIPMFTSSTQLDRCVVIELKGNSAATLTANRDGLIYRYLSQYEQFLLNLAVNQSKALKADRVTHTRYGGAKLSHRTVKAVTASTLVGDLTPNLPADPQLAAIIQTQGGRVTHGTAAGPVTEQVIVHPDTPATGASPGSYERMAGRASRRTSQLNEDFILRNELTLKIPAYYQPDSESFSTYGRKLVRIWGRLMLELHKLFAHEADFSIGFVFSDDAEAQHERGEYGTVYYINPAVVVETEQTRSFKKRFKLTERNRLLAIAAHEFLHGQGLGDHNEEYAGRLTDMFATIMDNKSRFTWCFA